MRLKDTSAVVTGGTHGLGLAIARRFAEEGARLVCAARSPRDVAVLEKEFPGRVSFHPVDVRDPHSVEDLLDHATRALGGLDVMVANAGVNRDGKLLRLPLTDWHDVIDTNLHGTLHCLRGAARRMTARGAGRIITVSSSMATRPSVGTGAYAASKAAIEALTRAAAAELGPKGVLVTCLAPGVLDGGLADRVIAEQPGLWKSWSGKYALGRPGRLEEAARAAAYLAGPDSTYVNGHVLEVNGGLLWA